MIGFTAERLMALEVEGLTGAGHGERSADRITHRNKAIVGQNGHFDNACRPRPGSLERYTRARVYPSERLAPNKDRPRARMTLMKHC